MLRALMALKPSHPLHPAGNVNLHPIEFSAFCRTTLHNDPNASSPTMNISNGVQGAGRIDIPQFQYLMLPLLKVMGGGHEMSTIQIRDAVADNLAMTAEA